MPYADSAGVKIWWDEQGSGTPVLLVMGFGNSSRLWEPVIERLRTTHRVIFFDNRGTGDSEQVAGPYTIEQMAADAVAVLDAAEIERSAVYGVSMGGVIAQEVAISYPDRVTHLVLGCTTCPKHMKGGSKVGLTLVLINPLLPRRLAARLMRPYAYDPTTSDALLAELKPVKERATATMTAAWRQSRGGLHETCSRAGTITAPTLVIHGEHDRLIPAVNGATLAGIIPNARQEVIANTGHMFFLEATEQSCALVDQHLAAT
jgi:pimeloyl-ACP methyl ester carboxylesterase